MVIHWIWLATRGVSDRLKGQLLTHFQDPEAIYFAKDYSPIQNLTPAGVESLEDKSLVEAEKILVDCRREGIEILPFSHERFPEKLRNIADPPMVLYYRGDLPDFDALPVIGVVGTRKASLYGMNVAKRLGYQIAKCGGLVVSGMASGIDGIAMSGAMTAGEPVVGVLGCGVDIVYPRSNRQLFDDTLRYGCILSEFPPGTPPAPWNFPRRNRIISGISDGVLVVEAPEKSGALITARQAMDQGRDVFVVPGNIDTVSCIGSNRLLRDGALAVGSGWDILSEYESRYPGLVRNSAADAPAPIQEMPQQMVAQKPRIPEKKQPSAKAADKKVIDKEQSTPYIDLNKTIASLTADEQTVVRSLNGGEGLVDDVIAESGLPAGKVLALLTLMEVKGVIRRLPGKRIALRQSKP